MLDGLIWRSKAAGFGLAVGLLMGGTALTFAQVQGLAGEDAGVLAMKAQIDALTLRINDLEKTVQEPKKAPFTVTDAAGKPIFTVASEGGGAAVNVYGPKGTISLNAAERLSLLLDSGGNSAASLSADGDGPGLVLNNGDSSVIAGSEGGAMSVAVQQGNNKATLKSSDMASLTLESGDGSAFINAASDGPGMLLHKGDANIVAGMTDGAPSLEVQTGSNKVSLKASDHASLSIDSGDGSAFFNADADGPGMLLHKGDANIVAGMNGGTPSLEVDNGPNKVTLKASDQASLSIDSGDGSAYINTDSDGPSLLFHKGDSNITAAATGGAPTFVVQKGANNATLSVKDGEGADFGMTVGSQKFFHVVGQEGGYGTLTIGGDEARAWRLLTAPNGVLLEGKSDGKMVNLESGQVVTGLVVGPPEKPQAAIGTANGRPLMALYGTGDYPMLSAGYMDDGQPAFRVRQVEGGKTLAALTANGTENGKLSLFDAKGEVARLSAIGGSGTLALYDGPAPTLTMGPTDSRPNPAFRAYDGKNLALSASAHEGGGGLYVLSGDLIGAAIEAGTSGHGTVYVNSNGEPVASINSTDNPGQGLVVVRKGGVAVASLGYGSSGGGNVTAMDPAGNGVFSAGYTGADGPGSACVEHKGTKCLGIGLTGMEGMH